MKRMKCCCAALLALCLCLSGTAVASAPGETLDITYVPIEYDGFVAESMDGIDAIYNLTIASPNCGEVVDRYYRAIYGVRVMLGEEPQVVGTDEFWFEETTNPQHGDILFARAEDRGLDHYGLCRSYDAEAGRLMVFEQNWIWDGKAGTQRVIAFPGVYRAFTLCSAEGAVPPQEPQESQKPIQPEEPEPALPPVEPFGENGPSAWAEIYVLRAESLGVIDRREGQYQKPIRRGDYAKLVVDAAVRMLGMQPTTDGICAQAAELGLMGGDGHGNFYEDNSLTREEGAVVMERLLKLLGSSVPPDQSCLEGYADRETISWWAADAVSVMTQTGLMGGTGTGFDPKAALTLEQAIALLMRAYDTGAVI